ncbi:MAG TPA: hypothetical protein VM686_29545 [Polyangiaceae bacterium]|nr:hypothetical protein [Polyangiaceae bacterium]
MARLVASAAFALVLVVGRATPLFAQSSASFPPEPGSTPAPPPAAPPPAPPTAPAPPAPTASEQSWLDQRGPLVVSAPQPPVSAPAPAASDFRPPLLPYRDGLPVPAGYDVVDRPASGLLITGASLLAASYGLGLMLAAGEDFENGSGWMALPVVGPWAAIGSRSFSCGPVSAQTTNQCVGDAFDEVEKIVFIAVDGLVQATSVGLLIAGVASGEQELVRKDVKVGFVPPLPGRSAWRVGMSGEF